MDRVVTCDGCIHRNVCREAEAMKGLNDAIQSLVYNTISPSKDFLDSVRVFCKQYMKTEGYKAPYHFEDHSSYKRSDICP